MPAVPACLGPVLCSVHIWQCEESGALLVPLPLPAPIRWLFLYCEAGKIWVCPITIVKSPSVSGAYVAVCGPVPPFWRTSTSLSQWERNLASTKAKYFFHMCHFFCKIMPHLSFFMFILIALLRKIYN